MYRKALYRSHSVDEPRRLDVDSFDDPEHELGEHLRTAMISLHAGTQYRMEGELSSFREGSGWPQKPYRRVLSTKSWSRSLTMSVTVRIAYITGMVPL